MKRPAERAHVADWWVASTSHQPRICGSTAMPEADAGTTTRVRKQALVLLYTAWNRNWDQIEGSWKQVKGKAKEQWGRLTDDELDVLGGKRDRLVGKIQERYGYEREQAEREVDEAARRW